MRLARTDDADKTLVALASALVRVKLDQAERGLDEPWTPERSMTLDRAQAFAEVFHAVSGACEGQHLPGWSATGDACYPACRPAAAKSASGGGA